MMQEIFDRKKLQDFYIKHLKECILHFWMPRCLDKDYGAYLNCYDNRGEELLSYNKFTWSQGRFVWVFSKLASLKTAIFSDAEREEFCAYARNGAEFLRQNVLLSDKLACSYLMDRSGKHLYFDDSSRIYDGSIYADFFVIYGFAKYAVLANDKSYYDFAITLYQSVLQRIKNEDYHVLPYVRPCGRRMHGIPMISLNTVTELWRTCNAFGIDNANLELDMRGYVNDILTNFCDQNYLIHEVISDNNTFTDDMLGRHINPGHTIEDLWFLADAAEILENPEAMNKCSKILEKTLSIGWDQEFGGIYLYCDLEGGKPCGSINPEHIESDMVKRLQNNWGSKLFWVHSESLYSVLRFYLQSKNNKLWEQYQKIHAYTFATFPNKNKEIGEWIQVRNRDSSGNNAVVGLPVKDPFHITRNLIQVIELLNSDE